MRIIYAMNICMGIITSITSAILLTLFAVHLKRKAKYMSKRLSMVLPDETVNQMDAHIDGTIIRNRTHLASIAISHWLNANETRIAIDKPNKKPARDSKGRFVK